MLINFTQTTPTAPPGPGRDGCASVTRLDVLGFAALRALDHLEVDHLAVLEGLEPVDRDLGPVDEDVVLTVHGDEAVPLVGVEPLDGAVHHVTTCSARKIPGRIRHQSNRNGKLSQQPPATAGITEICVPSGVGVCKPSEKRTSSSATYTLTKRRSLPSSSTMRALMPG